LSKISFVPQQSAETLLVTLFKEFRKSPEVLLALMNEFQAPLNDPQDIQTILAKDALYNSVGITAYELYDEVNPIYVDFFIARYNIRK